MTSTIQNVSREMVAKGNHFDCGENSMLIQISDNGYSGPYAFSSSGFPNPKHKFKEVHQFVFHDVDDENHPSLGEFCITDNQAFELVKCLRHALDNDMNVVVHCHAGVCRSGAVAEVAVMMGFNDGGGNSRLPNVLVKKKMMQVLGLAYDEKAELKARYEKLLADKAEGKLYF